MRTGDHIISTRLGFEHHGMYIGDDQVIHYAGSSELFDKGSIEITSLANFTLGNGFRIKRHRAPAYNAAERIERALSRLGEDDYNLLFNNCEHFITWCFYGVSSSDQVNEAATKVVAAAAQPIATRIATPIVTQVAEETVKRGISTAAGLATTGAVASSTTAATATAVTTGVVTAGLTAATVTTVAAPIAVAAAAGYGVKKLVDWFWD